MNLPLGYWDKLAAKYPRYTDPSIQRDFAIIKEFAKSCGVDFADATMLDIGCGTGTLAIHFAKECQSIECLDVSKAMLDVFVQDRKELELEEKISIIQSSWDEFVPTKSYDITLASMTPAVSDEVQYAKFVQSSAKYGIFITWGGYKHNDLIDALMVHLGQTPPNIFSKMSHFETFLQSSHIKYKIDFFSSSWQDSYDLEDGVSYACDHIERFGIQASKKTIREFLRPYVQNNKITFTTNAQKGICVFFCN